MKRTFKTILSSVFVTIASTLIGQTHVDMAHIEGGSFVPLYGESGVEVVIDDFDLDIYPISNAEYLAFVKQYPKWRKSKVIKLFADERYLYGWPDDTTFPKDLNPNAPVTNVSWFAASDYCACQGKRLASVDEWEYVAMADEEVPDARKKETYNKYILSWYETPKTYVKPVGSTFQNYWGVYDMHGLVWEWTEDFNSVLITGDARNDSDKDSNLFCGSAAIGATDLMNYAAFMRYATRGSLKANYSMQNLGFRCAKSVNPTN